MQESGTRIIHSSDRETGAMMFHQSGQHLTLGCIQSRRERDDELKLFVKAGGTGAAKQENAGSGEHLWQIIVDFFGTAAGEQGDPVSGWVEIDRAGELFAGNLG
jgi:hypothetical protein